MFVYANDVQSYKKNIILYAIMLKKMRKNMLFLLKCMILRKFVQPITSYFIPWSRIYLLLLIHKSRRVNFPTYL